MLSLSYNHINHLNKRLVINLIGSTIPVSQAAIEIQLFANNKHLNNSIINNNKISIINEFFISNIIINKCNFMKCHDISNLNHFIDISSLYSYKSYSLIVKTNSKYDNEFINKYNLLNCKHISDIYNIQDPNYNKKNMIYYYLL